MKDSSGSTLARGRGGRLALLLAGLLLPQALLYGPALLGQTILLPLDLLGRSYVYFAEPPRPDFTPVSSYVLSDQIFIFEWCRRFHAHELRAGRLPLWTPDIYCGTPFAVFPNFSPFQLIYILFNSPLALPWMEVAKALVAGSGMYLFLRLSLGLTFWPATVAAWCLPLTSFCILWQGYYLSHTTPWLPWLLLATQQAIRCPTGGGPALLAIITALTLISGAIDIALQVLLTSGLYALWLLARGGHESPVSSAVSEPAQITEGSPSPCVWRWRGQLLAASLTLVGWLLGIALAGPYLGPLAEYLPTGSRMIQRAEGDESRPPTGILALGPMVLPDLNGTHQPHSCYSGSNNLLESSSAGSAGILATLLLLPLAWSDRRRWADNFFWLGLAFFAAGWTLDLPGLVQLLRLPILNLMSHNRFVFVTSFCVLVLAATGLESLCQGQLVWRWWRGRETVMASEQRWRVPLLALVLPVLLLLALGLWCSYRLVELPEQVQTIQASNQEKGPIIATSYRLVYARGVVLSGIALLLLFYLVLGGTRRRWWRLVLPLLMLAELLAFAWQQNPQCDPALYYPRLPLFDRLHSAGPGRVLPVDCLGANLPALHGLRDLRGYDAVDPQLLLQVVIPVIDPKATQPPYARTQWYFPQYSFDADGRIRLPAVLNMLHLRYLVFRGTPPANAQVRWQVSGYWVVENFHALPRAFVPEAVVAAPGQEAALVHLHHPRFHPRKIAYVDAEVSYLGPCRGEAMVEEETPCCVVLRVNMQTAGLVVLADRWASGWRAELDGQDVPVLRTNHMLRGVEVPAGTHRLRFIYDPAGFRWGLRLCLGAGVVLLLWQGLRCRRRGLDG